MITEFVKLCYRKIISNFFGWKCRSDEGYTDAQASKIIEDAINSDKPFLCSRLGCTELQGIIFDRYATKPVLRWFLKPFKKDVRKSLHNSSGVFNLDNDGLDRFSKLYLDLMSQIDLLGSWHASESFFKDQLEHCDKIKLRQIGPDIQNISWTKALKGKKVLVVSPFTDTIASQYEKRDILFEKTDILPQFKELLLLKSVQSIAGTVPQGYTDWFDALESMKREMATKDFDIALIGCGAYGFPLGAYAKQLGRKAIVIGGPLQLLFGIQGRRWLERGGDCARIMNRPGWVKPSASETPASIERVPGSGYW